jgi:hypothetical protein
MRPPLEIVIWPAFVAVPVVGQVLGMPHVWRSLQLRGATRLMVNVCVRVAKFSFNMPYWKPNESRS